MHLNKLILLTLFAFIFQFSIAQDESYQAVSDLQAVKEQLRTNSESTTSVSSNFIQEKHLTMMDEVLISEGRFLFKKENKVRWEYTDPINYAIIINGNKFTINNDGKISEFDAESNTLFKEVNKMIVMAIQGNFIDNPDYDARFFENDKYILAVLQPNNKMLENILVSIEVYFSRMDNNVEMVKFIESGDDFTKTVFKNRKVNIDISDEHFNAQ